MDLSPAVEMTMPGARGLGQSCLGQWIQQQQKLSSAVQTARGLVCTRRSWQDSSQYLQGCQVELGSIRAMNLQCFISGPDDPTGALRVRLGPVLVGILLDESFDKPIDQSLTRWVLLDDFSNTGGVVAVLRDELLPVVFEGCLEAARSRCTRRVPQRRPVVPDTV